MSNSVARKKDLNRAIYFLKLPIISTTSRPHIRTRFAPFVNNDITLFVGIAEGKEIRGKWAELSWQISLRKKIQSDRSGGRRMDLCREIIG